MLLAERRLMNVPSLPGQTLSLLQPAPPRLKARRRRQALAVIRMLRTERLAPHFQGLPNQPFRLGSPAERFVQRPQVVHALGAVWVPFAQHAHANLQRPW